MPDEAVIAVNDFIEAFYARFQNHYLAQMHRYDQARPDADAAVLTEIQERWRSRRNFVH